MAKLNSDPGSSTSKQRQTMHVLAQRLGWSKEELHDALGVESVRELSAADASQWIAKLGGGDLPFEPGTKPAPYAGQRQRAAGAIRILRPDHVDQIKRLGVEHFGDVDSLLAWLHKDFKTEHSLARKPEDIDRMIRSLGTAKRAGQVIRVLKEMIARRASGGAGEPAKSRAQKRLNPGLSKALRRSFDLVSTTEFSTRSQRARSNERRGHARERSPFPVRHFQRNRMTFPRVS